MLSSQLIPLSSFTFHSNSYCIIPLQNHTKLPFLLTDLYIQALEYCNTRFIIVLGQVFIQSDVLEVAVDMRKQFDLEPGALQHVDTVDPSVLCDDEGWLMNNPMGIRTEREIHAEFEGAKIYRRLYQKRIH